VLCAAARFHPDQAWRPVRKMLQEACPLDLLADDLACLHVNPMQLKYPFSRIHTHDSFGNVHDGSSGLPAKISFFHLWHSDAVGP
jgi:hypothetical protein